jgi:hypothetical protein
MILSIFPPACNVSAAAYQSGIFSTLHLYRDTIAETHSTRYRVPSDSRRKILKILRLISRVGHALQSSRSRLARRTPELHTLRCRGLHIHGFLLRGFSLKLIGRVLAPFN